MVRTGALVAAVERIATPSALAVAAEPGIRHQVWWCDWLILSWWRTVLVPSICPLSALHSSPNVAMLFCSLNVVMTWILQTLCVVTLLWTSVQSESLAV
jgi:hypothetical protein